MSGQEQIIENYLKHASHHSSGLSSRKALSNPSSPARSPLRAAIGGPSLGETDRSKSAGRSRKYMTLERQNR